MRKETRPQLSVSRLKSVASCGRAYELERVLRVPQRTAAWTARGTAVHTTIEEWEKSLRTLDPEEFYEGAWLLALEEEETKQPSKQLWHKTPRVKSVTQDIKLRKSDGLEQVRRYVERALDEADLWKVVESEVSFEIDFEEFIVIGKIDQVREWEDGELSLWDIKTGGDDGEGNIQLGTYRLGYTAAGGADITVGSYWYTKLDRASQPIDLTPYTYDYLKTEYQKLQQIIEHGLFLANPSIKGCKFCSVADHCVESKA